jgi:glutamate/tyrosine decarboxylase-like PLP-dependent enzyme
LPDPLTTPQDAVPALELVLDYARGYFADLDGPVRRPASDEAARSFAADFPDEGCGTLAALQQLLELGAEAHIRSSGPRFFHWVIGGCTPAALAADWFATLIDQNAGAWSSSPLAVRLEAISLAWLQELFGLPAAWGGVLTTGATTANFTALAAARQWWGVQRGVDVAATGLARLPPVPVLSSGFIHVASLKALAMLGIGRDQVTICEADRTGRLDLAGLERELKRLRGAPAIVIATAGEVNAGHFDPIAELSDLAHKHGAWLHVDGAFGLFARVSPRTAALADGVERADSVISDGHKWLNVPFDCGFAFVRDPALLTAVFSALADYTPEEEIFAFRSPEFSRRARSLAVWATLAAYGRSGHRAIVERCLDLAAHVADEVELADDLELLAPAPLNIVCFRYRPPDVPEDALDELNLEIGRAVLTDGRVYVGTTRWRGSVGFRPAFVNWRTTTADADLLLETVRDLGRRLTQQRTTPSFRTVSPSAHELPISGRSRERGSGQQTGSKRSKPASRNDAEGEPK